MAKLQEEGWYPAVLGESGSAAVMVTGSTLLVAWVILRTQVGIAALSGAVLGATACAGLGTQEARYIVKGLQTWGSVTRSWSDLPLGAIATVVPAVLGIMAGYSGAAGVMIACLSFFLLQGAVSSAVALFDLWRFQLTAGTRVMERRDGASFEYLKE